MLINNKVGFFLFQLCGEILWVGKRFLLIILFPQRAQGILTEMEHFCILTVVVDTQSYTWKNWVRTTHRCRYANIQRHADMQRDRPTSTYKTDDIWISSMACTNVSFLVLILFYSYARCYHWEKHFFAASGESTSCAEWSQSYLRRFILRHFLRSLQLVKHFIFVFF